MIFVRVIAHCIFNIKSLGLGCGTYLCLGDQPNSHVSCLCDSGISCFSQQFKLFSAFNLALLIVGPKPSALSAFSTNFGAQFNWVAYYIFIDFHR